MLKWSKVKYFFSGFISYNSTSTPRCASCQAASVPARPAPMTFTFAMAYASLLLVVFRVVVFLVVFLVVFFSVFASSATASVLSSEVFFL